MPREAPWWVLPSIGGTVLVLFAAALVMACLSGNETLQTTMITATVTLATAVVSYFFGSSNSSRRKDDALIATSNAANGVPTIERGS